MSDYLKMAVESSFNYLRKTNRLLIVNDKEDAFFHAFTSKYKVCPVLLIGSEYMDIPHHLGYSVTNLGLSLRQAHLDEALNAPVDVIYIDLTSMLSIGDTLVESISDNTLVIFKIRGELALEAVPSYITNNKQLVISGNLSSKKHDAEAYALFI